MMYGPWREMTKERDTKMCGNKYVEEKLNMYSHILNKLVYHILQKL